MFFPFLVELNSGMSKSQALFLSHCFMWAFKTRVGPPPKQTHKPFSNSETLTRQKGILS
jgi:hypothetical protein